MRSNQDEVARRAHGARPVLGDSPRATHSPARGTSLSPAQPCSGYHEHSQSRPQICQPALRSDPSPTFSPRTAGRKVHSLEGSPSSSTVPWWPPETSNKCTTSTFQVGGPQESEQPVGQSPPAVSRGQDAGLFSSPYDCLFGRPGGPAVKNPPISTGNIMRRGFSPGVGKIPWRRNWQPTPVFLPGESHGQRSLVGYSPRGHKELDTTEAT